MVCRTFTESSNSLSIKCWTHDKEGNSRHGYVVASCFWHKLNAISIDFCIHTEHCYLLSYKSKYEPHQPFCIFACLYRHILWMGRVNQNKKTQKKSVQFFEQHIMMTEFSCLSELSYNVGSLLSSFKTAYLLWPYIDCIVFRICLLLF